MGVAELLDKDKDGIISLEDWCSTLQDPGEEMIREFVLADVATRLLLRYEDVGAAFEAFIEKSLWCFSPGLGWGFFSSDG